MSELEKMQRDAYQTQRKKIIQIFVAAVLCLTLLTSVFGFIFIRMNQNTYVFYKEDGNVIYKAYLADNEFYSEEYLNGEHAYVTSLIEKMTADFTYNMIMDTQNADFQYSYRIDAQLEIQDKDSGAAIYNPHFELMPLQTGTLSGNALTLHKLVEIDYNSYNSLAQKFLATYKLNDVSCTLRVCMYVDIVGMSEDFVSDNNGHYTIELLIPLNQTTIKPNYATTVPTGEQMILAQNPNNKNVFKLFLILFGSLDLVALIVTVLFIILTRDEHIDYSRRVQKIVSNYKSYIQKVNNAFDTTGYQILYVDTFTEMLEIRDTLQIPILMFENDDKTCSQFMIAACTKILYLFEVKVDELEKNTQKPASEHDTDESVTIPPSTFTYTEEDIAEAMTTPNIPLDKIDYIDNTVEYIETKDAPGVEVIGVVWPEKPCQNKIYRYDPNGEILNEGDIVLVPSRDKARQKEIVRKATVAHGNYIADPSTLHHPLKKIISVVKRNLTSFGN